MLQKNKELENLIKRVFEVSSASEFEQLALAVFKFQYAQNAIYKSYIEALNIKVSEIEKIEQIPFLPIDFFKSHKIICSTGSIDKVFSSSGTTGKNTSKHFVNDISLYETSFTKTFEIFYGKSNLYKILALLPNYLERTGSSLVYMVDYLIKKSENSKSGFYKDDYSALYSEIIESENSKTPTIFIGVSYALLDFAAKHSLPMNNTICVETGGMKGRHKEITKIEMYETLKNSFPGIKIHSEYGMTELLSQAYSTNNAQYKTPPWMKILIRDLYDPFSYLPNGQRGGLNVIDLANINSCSFIETQDIGSKNDAFFTIEGRADNRELRGCNMLMDF